MNGDKDNLLKLYFTTIQLTNELYSYADLARYLGVSNAIIKNVYSDRTVLPSKSLTKHLSERFNKNPEVILKDIYSESFVIHCNEYTKLVALSLYYNFGYTLVINEHNYIECGKLRIPSSNRFIPYFAKMRKTGPELKYTIILDWCDISKGFPKVFMDSSDCVSITMNLMNPFYNSLYFSIISGLFALLKLKSMSDIKRIIVVFPTDEAVHYKCIREMLYDYQGGITPILYDENAEYSIRDVDMFNGI